MEDVIPNNVLPSTSSGPIVLARSILLSGIFTWTSPLAALTNLPQVTALHHRKVNCAAHSQTLSRLTINLHTLSINFSALHPSTLETTSASIDGDISV